jgi:uncharacterized protein involved in outer membrane biogenesis
VLGFLALAIAILVAIWDWNWFRGPVGRLASARMHREVTITGDLDVNLWSWQPRATIDGLRIADPKWAGPGDMADIDRLAVRIRLIPLLTGHLDVRLLRFERPRVRLYRDVGGRATWDFSDGKDTAPLRLPPIHRFVIRNGQLNYRDDQRKLSFSGSINAREVQGRLIRGFEMVGAGALNRQPFHLQVTGGPLLNIDRDKPYPFDADIRAGQTFVTAKGAVPKPFDLGHFYMDTTARGPDLEELYDLTGVPLPDTPPYNLHGRLTRDDRLFRITGLGGRVGSSDLAGSLSVDGSGKRPLLKAELRSRSLDFRDLGALFGGAPVHSQVASPQQVATAQALKAQQRLLPDATLKTDRIRAIDADVDYRATSIHNAPINIRAGSVRVKLDAGVLNADPLLLDLPQGRIAGNVRLDARKATPVTDLDLRLSNAQLEQIVPLHLGRGQPFTGAVVGRARLRGSGDSVHKAFANANGEVMVAIPSGEIRQAFAELMGVNVTKGLGLLSSDKTTPIRCGVAHFQARGGVFNADHIVFDTGPVLVTGSGTMNMDSERMDFKVQGHPKKLRLMHLILPITASGPMLSPHIGVQPGAAIAQGGIAVALGTFLSPLAAILPFIDPGLAKDANCGALIGEARQQGAPVTRAQARTAPR